MAKQKPQVTVKANNKSEEGSVFLPGAFTRAMLMLAMLLLGYMWGARNEARLSRDYYAARENEAVLNMPALERQTGRLVRTGRGHLATVLDKASKAVDAD